MAPPGVRDEPRLRAAAVGLGLIPPRRMHSDADARVLAGAAAGARCAVEIGVYEGSSAVALCRVLDAGAQLHLVDPFGQHPGALRPGWGATEWATRRVVARAARGGPSVVWHVALSHEVASGFAGRPDLVFVDGDHTPEGVRLDWEGWHALVAPGGRVVFHDARLGQPGGEGWPGPSGLVDELFRGPQAVAGWEIVDEADRTVCVRSAR